LIEVKNVTKRYGKFYAVRNISFEVKDGEIVGFLGRNGAGKSTTMNMITGFIEPTEGQIIVNGYDIDSKPKKVKQQIGYMPEGVPLYSDLTVKEFVSYMADLKLIKRKDKKAAVQKAINETGLDKVQNKLTKNLSRGYKQRVSLAGAIVGDPKILILDEPTVGLDPKQVIEIRELIKSFRKDHTVILSSHILSEVSQICEKVIIIDKGEIVAVDTPSNLEKNTEETQKIELNVEDPNDKFLDLKEVISEIKNIKFIKTKDDGTKLYEVETLENSDIRKNIFAECAKSEITILEMKKQENSLEDAFIKLVEDRPEYSEKEIRKMQYDKEIEELRQEEIEKKERKEFRKQAKKEEKARKKANKSDKKTDKLQKDKKEDKTDKEKKTTSKKSAEVNKEKKTNSKDSEKNSKSTKKDNKEINEANKKADKEDKKEKSSKTNKKEKGGDK
jgi:ABC-2 type transport system ATP-binding protein